MKCCFLILFILIYGYLDPFVMHLHYLIIILNSLPELVGVSFLDTLRLLKHINCMFLTLKLFLFHEMLSFTKIYSHINHLLPVQSPQNNDPFLVLPKPVFVESYTNIPITSDNVYADIPCNNPSFVPQDQPELEAYLLTCMFFSFDKYCNE